MNTDFIESMHTVMSLCFHLNAFKYAVVFFFIGTYLMLYDYTLILFIEIKWHEYSIICIVKHRPLMYKNVKKTFEILRSEITF